MKRLGQNLRYSLRRLTRDPGSSTVLLITAALGLGPAVTVFSVLAGVLLTLLPFAQPANLVQISEISLQFGGGQPVAASGLNLAFWRERKNVFQGVAGARLAWANLSGVGEPEEVEAPQVTSSFFSVLGVPPILGRTFSPEDEAPEGATRVAVISHRLWQGRFRGDQGVIGRTIRLDGRAVEIVGVAPAGFLYPGSAEIWEPRRIEGNDPLRGLRIFLAVARLQDGVSREAAQADLSALSRSLEKEYPAENRGWSARLRPLGESEIAGIRPRLAVLFAAALLTLLIAGANAANLLLARLASRERVDQGDEPGRGGVLLGEIPALDQGMPSTRK